MAERLKFEIPETGEESNEAPEIFHVVLDGESAVLEIAELFTEAELVAALAEVFPLIAAVVGQWVSLGAGYLAARKEIAHENMLSGFSHGVVMGADGRKPDMLKEYFWKFSPDFNPADEDAGVIAQNCNNVGLVAGFMQGRELSKGQKQVFWKDIGTRAGDQSFRGDSENWGRNEWIDWYIFAGAIFRENHME